MADERLRRAERVAAQGGTEAEAALLRERLRTNRLGRACALVAAYCGDRATRLALGEETEIRVPGGLRISGAHEGTENPWWLAPDTWTCEDFLHPLAHDFQVAVAVRAALAPCQAFAVALDLPDRAPGRRAIELALRWLGDQTNEGLQAKCVQLAREIRLTGGIFANLAWAAGQVRPGDHRRSAGRGHAAVALDNARVALGDPATRALVSGALIEWALG